jgi:hypothetical protein
MNPRSGASFEPSLSAEQRAVEAELRAYATRVTSEPAADFVDRVMAEVERRPLPIAARGPRALTAGLVSAAGTRLRVAFAQVAGGPTVPRKVRVQAAVTLIVAALLITASAALAAEGAVSVANWVSEPQAPAITSQGPATSSAGQEPSIAAQPGGGYGRTDHPNPSDHPGNKPSENPGNKPSRHPNPSDHPGNKPSENPGNKPSENPGNKPSSHPNPSDHPGNGGKS